MSVSVTMEGRGTVRVSVTEIARVRLRERAAGLRGHVVPLSRHAGCLCLGLGTAA